MYDPIYGLIMIAAVAVGWTLSRRRQSQLALSRSERLAVGLGAFCGAMICAKLPFVLSDTAGLLNGTAWFQDGKTIVCGLVGGYLGVEVAKWTMDIRVKTGDSFAAPVAASIGIGRLGCFYAGCCYGTPTDLPWGVAFPLVDQLPRHPTQIYESVFHLSMAVLLWQLTNRGVWRGQLIKFYILSYLCYRFISETLRPEARLWGGLTGYQWGVLALMPLFVWLWVRDARAAEQNVAGTTSESL